MEFARRFARKVEGAFILLSLKEDEARVHKGGIDFDFVGFTDLDDDLRRRDFTINAIAYDLKEERIYDPFLGQKDLKRKLLRPVDRGSLELDPLRILRGFRFSLELGFKLDPAFFYQARSVSLKGIAGERIWMEFSRILKQECFKVIGKLDELGCLVDMMPEIEPLQKSPYWQHSLLTLKYIETAIKEPILKDLEPEYHDYLGIDFRIPILKLAGLLHDLAKPHTRFEKDGEVHFYGHDTLGSQIAKGIGKERLRLSNQETKLLTRLIKEHMRPHLLCGGELTDRAIRRFLRDLGDDFIGAMILAWADGKATAGKTRHLKKLYKRIITFYRIEKEKASFKRLINGYDLIELGLKPGPIFKQILNEVEEQQRDGLIKTKAEAIALAKKLIEEV